MDDEGDEQLADTPGKHRLIIVSALLPLVMFFGLIVYVIAQPGGNYSLRNAGWDVHIPVDRKIAEPIFIGVTGIFLFIFLRAGWVGWHRAKSGAKMADRLALGELVRWQGRPLWRSFRGPRVVGAALALLVPALLLWWIGRIWMSGNTVIENLFFTLLVSSFLFGTVIPALISTSSYMKAWWCDLFGAIAVTDRRIVWLTPIRQSVYRQIAAAEIVDAFVPEPGARRGSLTVIRRERDDVETIYLDGLPEPDRALIAVRSLIRTEPA